ncbi:MAG: hypothetical protein B7Y80_06280 [Hyphomicrobium sp. 32-62-53]|nr:MAG: hypothetical protein B7Y80_06280 [Hyphomicrobium sp. 32-62-53]
MQATSTVVLVVASKRRQVSGLEAVVALVPSDVAAVVASSDLEVADAVAGSSFAGLLLATAFDLAGFSTVFDAGFCLAGFAADLLLAGACFLAAVGFLYAGFFAPPLPFGRSGLLAG